MYITGIGNGENRSRFLVKMEKSVKTEHTQTAQSAQTDTVSISKKGEATYDTDIENWKDARKDTFDLTENASMEQDFIEEEKQVSVSDAEENAAKTSEGSGGRVAVNVGKRMRQIAAAKSRGEVQQVLSLLQKDMSDCKAGMEKGWCDEAEIAKVQALLNSAQARLSQVSQETEDEVGISAFELASLM